jgi:hypothetical protein
MRLRRHLFGDGVTSSDGWWVRFEGRGTIRYRERDRSLILYGEWLLDGTFETPAEDDSHLYSHWAPPHTDEPVTAEDWRRILNNISTALTFLKISHHGPR